MLYIILKIYLAQISLDLYMNTNCFQCINFISVSFDSFTFICFSIFSFLLMYAAVLTFLQIFNRCGFPY